ncbi:hypothetical protein HPB49_002161 [Dermacentor silvarum]|uniref:Uncharacterized protein n=1 Tax=Dermacentor silvarum TaxID=543639 RepID=A0ACB8C6Y7_DERSI|nr:hypothetical protein HPB49_002161 [Dermacentor silvarum]
MWGRRSLRVPLVEPLTSGQRRLRKPNMAIAQCSIDVFEQLDDAARVEAYRTALSEAGALRTEVDQLRRELEGLKIMFTDGHDTAKEVDAPKPLLDPQLQASHDFFCNLLAPIVERIERLESKTREDSDAKSCQSRETSAASINLQRCSGNQRGKAKDEATLCISNSSGEDARDRLSSFAASSLPHLGKDVTAWFHQADFWFRTFSVHEEVAIPFIISRLPPKDFTWMCHHAKMANIATWVDVKAAFCHRYNIDCDVTSKQRMFGATQRAGESCTDFAYCKLDLMKQCNYPVLQKEKCQVIMATLSDRAKKHFFDKNFEKLNDMIDSFLHFDQISNSEENVKVLVVVEPPTPHTAERPVLVKRSSRKSMRNRQRKESIESSGTKLLYDCYSVIVEPMVADASEKIVKVLLTNCSPQAIVLPSQMTVGVIEEAGGIEDIELSVEDCQQILQISCLPSPEDLDEPPAYAVVDLQHCSIQIGDVNFDVGTTLSSNN